MRKIGVVLLCVLGFSQCHNKVFSLESLPKQYIQVGSYGGFAGTATTYFFFPNGQRFVGTSTLGSDEVASSKEIEKAKAKDFSQMVNSLKTMKFKDMDINKVGNMTYFIRLKTKKIDKSIQWDNMDTAPPIIASFYRETLKNIKTEAIN